MLAAFRGLVKFKVGEAGNVGGRVNGGSTLMVLAMLSCGSLVWIDTGSGVAAVSPSLRFGGVFPLIFLFFFVAARRLAVTYFHKKLFNIEDISQKVRKLKTRSCNGS